MQFINQKIAILGFGQEGQDLLVWLKKNSQNCQITVFDQKPASEIDQHKGIHYSLGKNYLKNGLASFDIIFRSPGVHRLHPVLLKAEKQGIAISSPIKLFFDLCPAKIIGVTGTKGKGTTASLIHQILKASGKTSYLAGNIGKPVLSLLPKLKPTDFVCLELSSFQLQDLHKSPHIAVVLNITSEHLDVHKNTQEYRQAKTNIIKHQSKQDIAVINLDYPVSRALAKKTQAKIYWFSRHKKTNAAYVKNNQLYFNDQLIGDTDKLLLRGQHNWENITAAISVAHLAGIKLSTIKKTVFSFKGLEHRLELVDTKNQIKFYNDSFSTTPETAIAAINSFTEPTTIILGGSYKGSDYTQLSKTIVKSKHLRALILIGEMAPTIEKAINQAGGFNGRIVKNLKTMDQIVKTALKFTPSGGVIVLSPACASFDMFTNYKDRGQQFKAVVKRLHAQK